MKPRPQPAATGVLAKTPFPHVLTYLVDRRLTGSVEFVAEDGRVSAFSVIEGFIAKTRTADPIEHLGRVLVELGFISDEVYARTLRVVAETRRLHGQILLEAGAITEAQLAEGLRVQQLRKLRHMFSLSPATAYAYFDGFDLLEDYGGPEVRRTDPLPIVWRAIRETPPQAHVRSAMARMGGVRLRVVQPQSIARFEFDRNERALVEVLMVRPCSLGDLVAYGYGDARLCELLVYCLLITKCIEFETAGPARVSASDGIPASARGPRGAPSSPGSLAHDSSPRPYGESGPASHAGAVPSSGVPSASGAGMGVRRSSRPPSPAHAARSSSPSLDGPRGPRGSIPDHLASLPSFEPIVASGDESAEAFSGASAGEGLAEGSAPRGDASSLPWGSRPEMPGRPSGDAFAHDVVHGGSEAGVRGAAGDLGAAQRPPPSQAPAAREASAFGGTPSGAPPARPSMSAMPAFGGAMGDAPLGVGAPASPLGSIPAGAMPAGGGPSRPPSGALMESGMNPPRMPSTPSMPAVGPSPRMPSTPAMPAVGQAPRIPSVAAMGAVGGPSRSPSIPAMGAVNPSGAPGPVPSASLRPSSGSSLTKEQEMLRDELLGLLEKLDSTDHFALLGVSTDAVSTEVQAAFFGLAKKWHPDRFPAALAEYREGCTRLFARIGEAHRTLSDSTKRLEYVKQIKEGAGAGDEEAEVANVMDALQHFQRAEVFFKRSEFDKAEELCRIAYQKDPTQADYLALLAWLEAQRLGPNDAAKLTERITMLDRAIQMNPKSERAHFYRGSLYKRLPNEARALQDFKTVLQLNPRNVDAARELRLAEMRGKGSMPPAQADKNDGGKGPRTASSPSGLFGKLFKR